MKKIALKRFGLSILCMIVILSCMTFGGCKKRHGTNEPDSSKELTYTDIELLSDGQSSYKIVIPDDADVNEQAAAVELEYFFALATGFSLPIITDNSVEFSESNTHISVGETSLKRNAQISADMKALGEDGFIIKRKGSTVFLLGGSSFGTVNAVYDFLKYTIEYEAFADDEFHYKKCVELKLPDFDLSDKPDIRTRSPGFYKITQDRAFARRMRVNTYKDHWGLWGHTHFKILGVDDTMKEGHPDWFNYDPEENLNAKQLCYTQRGTDELTGNSLPGSMRYEYVKNLKVIVEANLDKRYFMLGQQDYSTYCHCDACLKSNLTYGGSADESGGGPAATMMRFVNAVAKEMNEWLRETHPTTDISFATFAYHKTEIPPVKVENDVTIPYHPAVKAEKNVAIMIAPLDADYNHSIVDEQYNPRYAAAFGGWPAVAEKIVVWNYCTFFSNYFINFNNFTTMQQNYRYFSESGVDFLFDQSAVDDTHTSAFAELRMYIQSNLMWDTSLSLTELTRKFIKQYYKQAAPYVQEYYDLIFTRYAIFDAQKKDTGTEQQLFVYLNRSPHLLSKELWPKNLLEQCVKLFDEAIKLVEKETDSVLREKLTNRLKSERLSPRYLLLDLYRANMDSDALNDMINSFREDAMLLGFKQASEQWTPEETYLENKYTEWMQSIKERQ